MSVLPRRAVTSAHPSAPFWDCVILAGSLEFISTTFQELTGHDLEPGTKLDEIEQRYLDDADQLVR